MSLFEVICDRPRAHHGFSRINEDGYTALTRESDHVFVGKAPRYRLDRQTFVLDRQPRPPAVGAEPPSRFGSCPDRKE